MANSKEVTEKINNIAKKVNKELAEFYNRLDNVVAMSKAKVQSVKDNSRQVKPCGIAEQIEEISEEDRQIAISTVKGIESDVIKNKREFDYIDLSERGMDKGSKGSGDESDEVQLVSVGVPKWIQELERSVKSKLKRVKKREYFDAEALHRGITRKAKERGMKKVDYVYFLLDVSGSMSNFSYKGIPLLALLASYIPAIAKKYDGLWMQVDGDVIVPKELRKLGKGEIKSLVLTGGGGAEFDKATEWMKNNIRENKIENPIIIMASDAHENFDFELLPNTIFVTTQEGWDISHKYDNGLIKQGFPDASKGQKVIVIDID